MQKVIGEKIGKMIAEERKKQGISAKELERRSGISARAITYWETGKRTITEIDVADKVLKGLGLTYTIGGKK